MLVGKKSAMSLDTIELVALAAADCNSSTSKLEDVSVIVLRTLQLHSTAQKALLQDNGS